MEAVFRRSRAARSRRLAFLASGVAVIAVGLGVLAVRAAGWPGSTSGTPGPGATGVTPGTAPRESVFASGTTDGKAWRLAAVNLAEPGYRCLPGIVLNGQDGDLLQPGFLPGLALGNAAFFAVSPGSPGIGFAFLTLRPGVSRVTADLGNGTGLSLHPIPVTVCGQRFRLTGFEYPAQGVTRITARSAPGRPVGYAPPSAIFSPGSPEQSGTWVNIQGATGNVASGAIGSGRTGGTSWRMTVSLGPDGECFGAHLGPGGVAGASLCRPVGAPPRGVSFAPIPYAMPSGAIIWYPGTTNARTAYLLAQLSDGTAKRLTPAVVGGRKYFAVAVPEGIRLTRLTLYGTHRHELAVVTSFPPVK